MQFGFQYFVWIKSESKGKRAFVYIAQGPQNLSLQQHLICEKLPKFDIIDI